MRRPLFRGIIAPALAALALAGCGLGSSSDPAAPSGTSAIRLDGGAAYNGGGAGHLFVEADSGITFSGSGSVDASFPVPAYSFAPDLGASPVTVAANTVVKVYLGGGTAPIPAAGELFVIPSSGAADRNLYKSDGVSVAGSTVATGLKVAAGATLTIPANATYLGGSALETASIAFTGDVDVEGTIRTAGLDNTTVDGVSFPQAQRHGADATARDKAGAALQAHRILIGQGGSIDTSGANAASAGQRGGDAGIIALSASNGLVNRGAIVANGGNGNGDVGGNGPTYNTDADYLGTVYLWSTNGSLLNAGAITSSGGTGTTGGDTGTIQLESGLDVINTAALTANGGAANGVAVDGNLSQPRSGGFGYGGTPFGGINLISHGGSVLNSGALVTRGADGTYGSGCGGPISLSAGLFGSVGNVRNSGALDTSGGVITLAGGGGDSGAVSFFANGAILSSGAITAKGGTGKGAGSGGEGGQLAFAVDHSSDSDWENENAAGPIRISGTIDLSGGNGGEVGDASGGIAGSISVSTGDHGEGIGYYSTLPGTLPVEFLGYASIEANGGAGSVGAGGDAGFVHAFTYESHALDSDILLPAGPIACDVAIAARGGDGVTGGGAGGNVDFVTYSESALAVSPNPAFPLSTVSSAAGISVAGGNASGASATAGRSGNVSMYGYNKVDVSGRVNADGGNATGAGGTGGDAAWMGYVVELVSTFDVTVGGSVSAAGGNGTGANGSGGSAIGSISFQAGGLVRSPGSLRATGGNASGEGTNGSGGLIDLYSQGGGTVYGAFDAARGTGGTGGTDGVVRVDDVQLFGPIPQA